MRSSPAHIPGVKGWNECPEGLLVRQSWAPGPLLLAEEPPRARVFTPLRRAQAGLPAPPPRDPG